MRPRPPINYRVSQPKLVTDQFLQLFARAEQLGLRNIFLEASEYAMDELAYDPLHFGESRETLPHLELEMRVAFALPIYVEFAIHERTHQVFIRRFKMRE